MLHTTSATTIVAVPSDDLAQSDAFDATLDAVAGQLSKGSRRVYRGDARYFADWLTAHGLDIQSVRRDDIIAYRQHLADSHAKVTAARKLTVARRLLAEAVERGVRNDNPAATVRGFAGASNDETTHVVLTRSQARALLDAIDRTAHKGKRDYALISLMLRTGLRRAEVAGLRVGDMSVEQGHHVLLVRHGKGDKRRKAKLPVDVWRCISEYMVATQRTEAGAEATLFVRFYKGDTPGKTGMSGDAIEDVVAQYATAAGIADLSPHGLRASFITLTLEGGAKLQQVQYAAGHADPRTTERYQKRKLNLDDNATDYLRL